MNMIPTQDLFTTCRVINGKKYLSKNNEVFELDEVGEIVWESIDGQTPVNHIVSKISDMYQMEATVVKRDVENFLQELLSKQLIEG